MFAVAGRGVAQATVKNFVIVAAAVDIMASLAIDTSVFKLGSRCSRQSGCPLVVLLAAQAH